MTTSDPLHARLTDWVIANLAVPDVLTFDADDVADKLAEMVRAEVTLAGGLVTTADLRRRESLAFNALSSVDQDGVFVKLSTRQEMTKAALAAAGLPELVAERDRLRAALSKVLGEFNRDVSEYNEELPWFSAQLTPEELTEARKALAGGGTDG